MMGYLVYRSFGTNFELVESDYYKSELRYQEVIDGTDRANRLNTTVQLLQSPGLITLQMPDEMKNKNISGSILFYCAYDSKKDKKFILNIGQNGMQVFNNQAVAPGIYIVKVDWNNDGKNYYTEKNITII
jgi:hypothetical protein